MLPFEVPRIPPPELPAEALVRPGRFDLTFEGFAPEAFAILDRLRAEPHVEQYRREQEGVRAWITGPFKRYRDDLVVNWVLPNRLGFETEKNVFSRLLKNDFGAGGCHHHLWMSFYRPGRRRLTDFQLTHSLAPDGLTVGLYVGDYAQDLVRASVARIQAEPRRFAALLDALLARGGWRAFSYRGSGETRVELLQGHSPDQLKDQVKKASGLWFRTIIARDDVVALRGDVVPEAVSALFAVWPLYGFLAAGT